MLEYVFFHQQPLDRFVDFLREQGLEPEVACEDETWEAQLPEDLDDALCERIENFYDEMMDLNQALFNEEEGAGSDYHTAGVVLNLQDGKTVYANVSPLLLGRIMGVLTPEEFGEVVNAIVDAVEKPDERTLCQRMTNEQQRQ